MPKVKITKRNEQLSSNNLIPTFIIFDPENREILELNSTNISYQTEFDTEAQAIHASKEIMKDHMYDNGADQDEVIIYKAVKVLCAESEPKIEALDIPTKVKK